MKTLSQKVQVKLKDRGYNIFIGAGEISNLGKRLKKSKSKKAFLISDESLLKAREMTIQSLEKSGWDVYEIAVKAGESFKDFNSIYPIFGELLTAKANRDSTLFALGGGSVGDAAGFIASTFLRGIDWVGIPTTLLAQVDSSVGGKTGINHPQGKNLIGSFHQPSLVMCDVNFLKTLSLREIISGLGEVIKYSLIYDETFFDYLVKNWKLALNRDDVILSKIIKKSLQWKANVVSRDEYDRKGIREALNFGHTFGHAIEAETNYEFFQHGEAVIWGMRFALALSVIRKKMSEQQYKKARTLLDQITIPGLPLHKTMDHYLSHMKKDKKIRDGKLHFVLLKKIGRTISDDNVTHEQFEKAFMMIRGPDYGG